VYSVDLVNTSVSISGNSPANNKKYQKGHILNPKTGNFIDKMAMVCVTGPSAFLAEILSTALFAQGDEIQQDIISDFEGYNAVFIDYTQSSTQPIIMEIEKSGYNVK
jgi:thiamine biosynthesis lipoprotein